MSEILLGVRDLNMDYGHIRILKGIYIKVAKDNDVSEIFKTLNELSRQGITILLVEQNAKIALEISHYRQLYLLFFIFF